MVKLSLTIMLVFCETIYPRSFNAAIQDGIDNAVKGRWLQVWHKFSSLHVISGLKAYQEALLDILNFNYRQETFCQQCEQFIPRTIPTVIIANTRSILLSARLLSTSGSRNRNLTHMFARVVVNGIAFGWGAVINIHTASTKSKVSHLCHWRARGILTAQLCSLRIRYSNINMPIFVSISPNYRSTKAIAFGKQTTTEQSLFLIELDNRLAGHSFYVRRIIPHLFDVALAVLAVYIQRLVESVVTCYANCQRQIIDSTVRIHLISSTRRRRWSPLAAATNLNTPSYM